MTTLTQPIIKAMTANGGCMTNHEIRDIVAPAADIVVINGALHDLQDTGYVLMRNGFYRLSEKAKAA